MTLVQSVVLSVTGLAGLLFVAVGVRTRPGPHSEQSLARTFAYECGVARERGLLPRADRRAPGAVTESFELPAGHCFSLVVSTTGDAPLAPLEVVDAAGDRLGVDEPNLYDGFVRHVAWCAPRGGRFTVSVAARGALHLARFEGAVPPSRWPLRRARPRPEHLPTLEAELVESRLAGLRAGDPLAEFTVAAGAAPALLPSTPATRAALRDATFAAPERVAAVPSPVALRAFDLADPSPPTAATAPASGAVSSFALFDDALRLFAALDPGAFRRRCVTLLVRPPADMTEAVYRMEIPGWRMTPLVARDGLIAERRCATDPLTLYVTSSRFPGALWFALDRVTGPDDATVTASGWRGEALPHSLLARLQSECPGDPGACMTLGRLGTSALPAALRPDAADGYRRACAAQVWEGCARLALLVRSPAGSRGLLTRACAGGVAAACALVAGRSRLGGDGWAPDMAAASDGYERACALGDAASCERRDAMRLLHLTP
ncbi:MAG: hypothetical protein Q8S73_04805 [Deltaproteobacteria bacterium]|nr:hypothetical protein [Myxococcales bacterium]MDP3213398.1 hypothetical protein [Deltaproteobacteria bacterium]